MKKLLLSIICLFVSYTSFCQVDGNYNYSIGVRGYSLLQLPKVLNQTNSQDYIPAYLNGAIVKFNDNQISFRLSGNYYRKSTTFSNNCSTCELATGNVTDYSFKVGFEKNFNYSRVQPYFATDLGFRMNSFRGMVKSNNPENLSMPYDVNAEKNGLVVTPIMGIKINPIKQISIFAETSLDFYYSYERQETTQHDVFNTRTFAKYNKWEFLLNPISIGLQIHLIDRN
jgi:hypothetical protein